MSDGQPYIPSTTIFPDGSKLYRNKEGDVVRITIPTGAAREPKGGWQAFAATLGHGNKDSELGG